MHILLGIVLGIGLTFVGLIGWIGYIERDSMREYRADPHLTD